MRFKPNQVPWNKGMRLPEEYCAKISNGRRGLHFKQEHKDRIAETQKKRWALQRLPECSQCSLKQDATNPLFKVLIPAVSDHILTLCDQCTIDQYRGLTSQQKQEVQVLS